MFAVGYGYSFLLPLAGGAAWDLSRIPATAFLPAFAGAATTLLAGMGLPHDAAARRTEPSMTPPGEAGRGPAEGSG
jgi:hypothetical protein